MNTSIRSLLFIGCVACLGGCAGSRREEPLPSPPARSMEVSVIPEQELKKGRPFVGFSASAPLPDSSTPAISSDSFSGQP